MLPSHGHHLPASDTRGSNDFFGHVALNAEDEDAHGLDATAGDPFLTASPYQPHTVPKPTALGKLLTKFFMEYIKNMISA